MKIISMKILGLPAVAFLLVVSGCASRSPDPFGSSGTPSEREGLETHRVRFEVSCDTCAIRWSAAQYGNNLREEGLWSESINLTVYPGDPPVARLSAAPLPRAGGVSWIRIRVDGEVAAEARPDASGMPEGEVLRTLSVETRVPPGGGSSACRGGGCASPPSYPEGT